VNEITEPAPSSEPDLVDGAITRRRALQAALGVGVAAAAWSLPQVVAVAQVPVPGGVCTAPLKSTTLPFLKNVKCDSACVQGGVNYVTFLDDSTGGISVAFTPRLVAPTGTNGCSAPSVGDPNNPTNDPNAGAPYKITTSGIFTGYTCFIQSMLLKNQGLIRHGAWVHTGRQGKRLFVVQRPGTGLQPGVLPKPVFSPSLIQTCSSLLSISVRCEPTTG